MENEGSKCEEAVFVWAEIWHFGKRHLTFGVWCLPIILQKKILVKKKMFREVYNAKDDHLTLFFH